MRSHRNASVAGLRALAVVVYSSQQREYSSHLPRGMPLVGRRDYYWFIPLSPSPVLLPKCLAGRGANANDPDDLDDLLPLAPDAPLRVIGLIVDLPALAPGNPPAAVPNPGEPNLAEPNPEDPNPEDPNPGEPNPEEPNPEDLNLAEHHEAVPNPAEPNVAEPFAFAAPPEEDARNEDDARNGDDAPEEQNAVDAPDLPNLAEALPDVQTPVLTPAQAAGAAAMRRAAASWVQETGEANESDIPAGAGGGNRSEERSEKYFEEIPNPPDGEAIREVSGGIEDVQVRDADPAAEAGESTVNEVDISAAAAEEEVTNMAEGPSQADIIRDNPLGDGAAGDFVGGDEEGIPNAVGGGAQLRPNAGGRAGIEGQGQDRVVPDQPPLPPNMAQRGQEEEGGEEERVRRDEGGAMVEGEEDGRVGGEEAPFGLEDWLGTVVACLIGLVYLSAIPSLMFLGPLLTGGEASLKSNAIIPVVVLSYVHYAQI